MITLTVLSAGLAGCIGGDDDAEQKTINIAGSSTVYPVASAWAQAYSASNSDYTVTVAGGGSGAGASKVCSTDADSVHIGDMSRDWKSSEASVGEDGYTFSCLSSDITVTQLVVAIDGLSVVVKKGGIADQCISAMGGLSMAQLRWIFSDWSETDLANHPEGGLDMNSTTPSNDDDGIRDLVKQYLDQKQQVLPLCVQCDLSILLYKLDYVFVPLHIQQRYCKLPHNSKTISLHPKNTPSPRRVFQDYPEMEGVAAYSTHCETWMFVFPAVCQATLHGFLAILF